MKLHSYKLIIMAFIITMFVLSFTSALDNQLNNVKDYSPETKTITISDNYIFWKVPIANATLDTPQLNYVPTGKNVSVARMTIDIVSSNYSDFISKIEVYDKATMKPINRTITYKYATFEYYNHTSYVSTCGIPTGEYFENGSEITSCNTTTVVTQIEKTIWHDFDNSNMPQGITVVGLFADVLPGDYVEWIPTFAGVRSPEFAAWTNSFNVGLVHYYGLDQALGNPMIDSAGSGRDLVLGAGQTNSTGIHLRALYGDGTSGGATVGSMEANLAPTASTTNFSFNLWVYPDGTPTNGASPIQKIQDGSHFWMVWGAGGGGCSDLGQRIELGFSNSGPGICVQDGVTKWIPNVWQMLTVVQNDSGAYLYVNGSFIASTTTLKIATTANLTYKIRIVT